MNKGVKVMRCSLTQWWLRVPWNILRRLDMKIARNTRMVIFATIAMLIPAVPPVQAAVPIPHKTIPHFRAFAMSFSYIPIKTYARLALQAKGRASEYHCLNAIYTRESHWNPKAYNHTSVDGWHAGGIPQILGLSTTLSPYQQIERGLKYIDARYHGSPCLAWAFWKVNYSY